MKHSIVTIDASPKQLSKLRNGHRVRIKKGTGFNLIIHPETFHLVSRAFQKDKGIEVQLSPEEIEMNRMFSPEQHQNLRETQKNFEALPFAGEGIFGKKFDRLLKKAGIKKTAYAVGDALKPLAKAGITAGLTAGATALGAVQPELVPFLPAGVAGMSGLAYDYLDNPSKYQRGFSGIKGKPVRSMAEQVVKSKLNEKLNEQLGTNYDYMSRAGIENAVAQQASAQLNKASIAPRFTQPPAGSSDDVMDAYNSNMYLRQLMGGSGLYAGGAIGRYRTMDRSIMGRGNVSAGAYLPPALVSQPLSANFQFQHFLPPAYQKFSGSGLYV